MASAELDCVSVQRTSILGIQVLVTDSHFH